MSALTTPDEIAAYFAALTAAERAEMQQRFDAAHAAINALREREGLPPITKWQTIRVDRPEPKP